MLFKPPRCLVRAVCLGALFAVAGAGAADAGPKLKEWRLSGDLLGAPEVRIRPENGVYVLLGSYKVTYRFSYRVKANRMLRWIYVSNQTVPINGTAPWVRGGISKNGDKQYTAWGDGEFSVYNNQIGGHRDLLLKACNDGVANGRSAAEGFETHAILPLSAQVTVGSALTRHEFTRLNGATYVKVVCEPDPSMIQTHPGPKVTSFTLKRDPNDTTCPKDYFLKATFKKRAEPGQAQDKVRFRVVIDGKPGDQVVKRMLKQNRKTLVATHEETLKLDPGRHEIKIAVVDGPDSEIKVRRVDCPPMAVNFVTLQYAVSGGDMCPRLIYEIAKFRVTRPNWLNYEIKHEGGLVVWSDRIKAKRHGDQYIAIGARVMHLDAFEADMMAQEKGRPENNSGWVKLKVDPCPPRSPNTSDSGDKTAPPRPTHDRPPPRIASVAPVPPIPSGPSSPASDEALKCPFGTVQKGQRCVAIDCPPGLERRRGLCLPKLPKVVKCPPYLKRVGQACVRPPREPDCESERLVRGKCLTLTKRTESAAQSAAPKRRKLLRLKKQQLKALRLQRLKAKRLQLGRLKAERRRAVRNLRKQRRMERRRRLRLGRGGGGRTRRFQPAW